jgi:type VI secretion system protein ImpE
MTATELYKAGNLAQAIDAQLKEVKANPADQGRRLFLFELLAFGGDLDRAQRQIDAIDYKEMEKDMALMGYKKALAAEKERRAFFKGGETPQFLGEVPEHARLRLDAAKHLRENRPAEASALLTQAAAATPEVKGQLNGKPFAGLRDGDDLFGGVLEVLAMGKYFWVPLEQVASLAMTEPRFPRDLLWVPARLEVHAGTKGEVFLPTLYPATHEHTDEQVKLGRATDWKSLDGGAVLGVGLRTFLVGEEAVSILEWRELVTEAPPAPPGEPPSA